MSEFTLRMFLIANRFASAAVGFGTMNFAELLREEEQNDVWMNRQMTKHFTASLEILCEMTASELSDLVNEIVENDEICSYTKEQIDALYREKVEYKIRLELYEE